MTAFRIARNCAHVAGRGCALAAGGLFILASGAISQDFLARPD